MILYIGNNLKSNVEPMMVQLSKGISQTHELILVSNKKNIFYRMLDIIINIVKRKKSIDVVIIDTFSTLAFYYTLISSLFLIIFRIPYIPILHGGKIESRFKRNPIMCKIIFGNSAHNVSPSKFNLNLLEDYGYKGTIIPNFLDFNDYKFRHREKLTPKLLWVRSFHKTYNPIMAIKVLKNIKTKYPNANLCMVGPDKDGEMNNCKKFAEDENLLDSIIFTGLLEKKEWVKMSVNYDIFINTTNADNLPVSLIEAMALGLPIVSTRVGGIPFLIDDEVDGILVDQDDYNAMSAQIFKLLENFDLARSLTLNAQEKSSIYAKDTVLSKWNQLLNSFL
jgi:glycosyltransferase involved in cell wall biosynthesis